MVPRERWALGCSLLIHAALVLLIGGSLVTPRRVVNRIEIDLEGAPVSSQALGVQSPAPTQMPTQPTTATIPMQTSVPLRMQISQAAPPRPAERFDSDASLAAPAVPGLPGSPAVALQRPSGGPRGGGSGRRGSGSGSALDGYRNEVRLRIDQAKRYPFIAQQRRLQGTAVIAFRLSSSGQLMSAPVLVASSGRELIDKAALRAVRRGAPYPQYPGERDPDGHPFEVPVRFHLR